MIKHNLIVALRNLAKYRSQTVISVASIGVSVTIFALISCIMFNISGDIHDLLRRSLHTVGFRREYRAVCVGCPNPAAGTIDAPIGRDDCSTVARIVRPDGAPAV